LTANVACGYFDKQYNNWWQKTSKQYYLERLDDLYPIVQKHDVQRPDVKVVKMQTLWGSCSRKLTKINLNYFLLKAPPPCIEYVILHELTHFIYPRHDKNFLDFLSVHMPDWRERTKLLDNEIVLGM
jgi:predicted metal-dependent hydrolase